MTTTRIDQIRRRLADHDEGLSSKAEEGFRTHASDDIALLLELADAVAEVEWEAGGGWPTERLMLAATRLQENEP